MANAAGIFSGVQTLLSARQGWTGQARMHVLDQDILEILKHQLANNHINQVVEQKSPLHCCQCATIDCIQALLPVDNACEMHFVCVAVE